MKKDKSKNSAILKTEEIASGDINAQNLEEVIQTPQEITAAESLRETVAEQKRAEQINKENLAAEKKEKAKLKKEECDKKRLEKRAVKQERRDAKRVKKANGGNKKQGFGGWLAAVISLGCAVLILGGLLTYVILSPIDDYMNFSANEERSFYELIGYVDDIDTNLSKIVVSNDDEQVQKLLSDVRVQSNLATESISNLSLHDEEKYYTTKFINQVGDFSKYLSNKLIEGKSLTGKDIDTLNTMYNINNLLKNELSLLSSNLDENFNFKSIYEDKKNNLVISKFIELEDKAVDYPHMIYDGAFSDGTESSSAKALENLSEVKKLEAEKIFKNAFKNYGIKNVELTGETSDKTIPCYNFDGKLSDGTSISATVSKKGGKIINFNNFKVAGEIKYSEDDCRTIADDFLKSLGISGMKAVWMTEGKSVDTFNYAYVQNGVVCYPDLIKVNVCRERGIVCSMEARSYYLNHETRNNFAAAITVSEAREKVSNKIEINSERLTIIPRQNGSEILAYEFTGVYNDETYYVYINAVTGKEANIFKVVKTTEGSLLL